MSTMQQRRLQKILQHLHSSVDTKAITICTCSSDEDTKKCSKCNKKYNPNNNKQCPFCSTTKTATNISAATTRIYDVKYAKQANDINKVVENANNALKKAAKHSQSHGYNAEIHTEATFNIDAIKKGSDLRARRNPDYHGAADIFIKNGNKIKTKAQIKCTTDTSYAKKAATNNKYDGMSKIVNKEMVNKHKNLKSNIEVDGVKSKSFKHSDMKNKKNFNKHKTSKNQLKKERMLNDAKSAAVFGGVTSGALSVATDIYEGDKSGEEIIKDAAVETAKGATIGAASSVMSAAIGTGPAAGILGVVDIAKYCYDNKDDLNTELVIKKTTSVAASTAGSSGGAYIGAIVGSVFPVGGTFVGGFIGGYIGGVAGSFFASKM